jgi:hypothetical protein
MIRVQA